MTIVGPFFANYNNIFEKDEVQTNILQYILAMAAAEAVYSVRNSSRLFRFFFLVFLFVV